MNTIQCVFANSIIERMRRSKLRAYALVASCTLLEASLQVPAKIFIGEMPCNFLILTPTSG